MHEIEASLSITFFINCAEFQLFFTYYENDLLMNEMDYSKMLNINQTNIRASLQLVH